MDTSANGKQVKITFCGGTETVTGANFLFEHESGEKRVRVLVDCGMFQGTHSEEKRNWEEFPYNPAEIDAVFVTHAHLDHIGRLPLLVKAGYKGPIYATPPTREITEIALLDAIGVMQKESHHESVKKNVPESDDKILYHEADVSAVMKLFHPLRYHEPVMIGDFTAVLRDSGHILGSAMVEFTYGTKKIVFTGDLGNSPTPLLKNNEMITDAEYLVMESVYGDRNHEDRDERREKLGLAIRDAVAHGGALLIPAFSIERTQELLFEIENMMEAGEIPRVPVYLDSPMGIRVTDIYKKYEQEYLNRETNEIERNGDGIFKFAQFRETPTTEESKAIDQSNPVKIVVAGSGMSNGGRIIHHEKKYLPDPKSTVLLAGYQSVGSLGRLLQDGARSVRILGDEIPVNARIISMSGYSAHKDSDALLEFVRQTADSLKKVFVVMGEPRSSLFLVQRIREYLGIDAVAPAAQESVEITL